jgi:lipopolysaccharide biosynthesis glycosyltransferase
MKKLLWNKLFHSVVSIVSIVFHLTGTTTHLRCFSQCSKEENENEVLKKVENIQNKTNILRTELEEVESSGSSKSQNKICFIGSLF